MKKIINFKNISIYFTAIFVSCTTIKPINKHIVISEVNSNLSTERMHKRDFKRSINPYRQTAIRHKSRSNHQSQFNFNIKNKKYGFWLKYYNKQGNKERLVRQLKRGLVYKKEIEKIFVSHGLPKDLFYVGLIESGYSTHIRSKAKAVGPWQFLKGTAKDHHLKVTWYQDDRRNILKSTEAAANYFKDLYNIFGSWELALCAYNAGENRIIRIIRKSNTRDYNELVRRKLLPRETISYIPKVLASKKIAIKLMKAISGVKIFKLSNFKTIKVRGISSLKSLSRKIKLSKSTLEKLNPEFSGRRLPKHKAFVFLIPKNKRIAKKLLAKYKNYSRVKRRIKNKKTRLISYKKRTRKYKERTNVKYRYKVVRGDNLTKLKNIFKTSLYALKKLNNFKRNKIFIGQNIYISTKSIIIYKVKKGDNLSRIANKFKVHISYIQFVNKLKSEKIILGQKLTIPTV